MNENGLIQQMYMNVWSLIGRTIMARIRRCGHGGVGKAQTKGWTWGFRSLSEAQSLTFCLQHENHVVSPQLLPQDHACLSATMLPVIMVMVNPLKLQVSRQINAVFYMLPWSWCLLKQLKSN